MRYPAVVDEQTKTVFIDLSSVVTDDDNELGAVVEYDLAMYAAALENSKYFGSAVIARHKELPKL